jgi:putative ABC transport system permease protein
VNPRESPLARAILLVRAKGDPADLLAPMRQAARDTDSRILARVHPMRDDFERNLEAPRLASAIAGVTALLALVLASLGIFGVVSHAARLRTKEIGIRMALGASRGAVMRTLLMGMTSSAAVGMALGFSGALPIGRLYAGAPLYLRPVDIPAYALAASVFTIAGALAMFVPVLRALRADPIRALRQE